MMMMSKRLLRDDEGGAVIELALALPVLVTMIYGIFECSQLYEANAGMQHALGEGARVATLCVPNTSKADGFVNRENAKLFGPYGGQFTVSNPASAAGYKTLTITYRRSMNFLLFRGPTITLSRSKQVYVADTTPPTPPPTTP